MRILFCWRKFSSCRGLPPCVAYRPMLGARHGKAAGPQLRARNYALNVLEGSVLLGSNAGFWDNSAVHLRNS